MQNTERVFQGVWLPSGGTPLSLEDFSCLDQLFLSLVSGGVHLLIWARKFQLVSPANREGEHRNILALRFRKKGSGRIEIENLDEVTSPLLSFRFTMLIPSL